MTIQAPSLWNLGIDDLLDDRVVLDSDKSCDVLIVGGGYTGLWTTFYLTKHAPHLDVAVVEAERVGYGASGRNGGWLSYLVPGNRSIYASRPQGHAGLVRLQREMVGAVDEVLEVATEHGLDIDAHKGGNLVVAPTEAGMERLRRRYAADIAAGLSTDEIQIMDARQVGERINVAGAVGGLWAEPCARIHPGKLVHQLARLVEGRGVRIYEGTRVTNISPHLAYANGKRINAGHVLICTEGFTGPLLGRRNIIPIKSSMVATQRLSKADWDQIGWEEAECLSDTAHTFIYAQRTADGRIALGGRGKPYHYGSHVDERHACSPKTKRALVDRLSRYFPDVKFEAEHAWSGVLGVSRDWCASVHHSADSGIGASVGYAGHGVASANLAARTLADLVLFRETDRTCLPFVDHRPRRWEPEPIRWLGIHGMYRLFRTADLHEERRAAKSTSLIARVAGRLAGLSP